MKQEYAKSNPQRLASTRKTRATILAKWFMIYIGLFFAEGLMAQSILLSEDYGDGLDPIISSSRGGMIVEADPTLAVNWKEVWVNTASYGADLQWITSSEENLQYFIVERSIDGNFFSPIGELAASGINGQGDSYSFPDNNIPNIGLGRFYYRIKVVDNNGASQTSSITELIINGKSTVNITLYPNRVGDLLQFDVISPSEDIQEILIDDGLGNKVWSGPISDFRTIKKLEIDLQNWSSGIYFLRILTENQVVVHKFHKQ